MPTKTRSTTSAAIPKGPSTARTIGNPVFAQPAPTPDPTAFLIKHPSDNPAYDELAKLNKDHKIAPLKFPLPKGLPEPILSFQDAVGGASASPVVKKQAAAIVERINASGQIVFHAGGDCGSVKSPQSQELVVDKMLGDFHESADFELPQFHYLLGDIVYSFGESKYYYDQFYNPFRDYPAPIFAVPGNHDGMLGPETHVKTLDAFLRNFCTPGFVVSPDAGMLTRTAQIQPGVFFTLDAPFVRILGMYSNALEDPGYISSPEIGDDQLKFLKAALQRVKQEQFAGALLFATHHPTYAGGGQHGGSPQMQKQIDDICNQVGVWPHAVLAGHAHSYQRFTRTRAGSDTQIPYVICGNSGHNHQLLRRSGPPVRTPQVLQPGSSTTDNVVFENYDDQDYGYLRIIVSAKQLRIEYHPASDGRAGKTPDDAVTIDLSSHKIVHYTARNLGYPKAANAVRDALNKQQGAPKKTSRR